MEPILTVSHLQKIYGDRGNHTRALDDLSFSVAPGEFVGIMGASGSGKSTLLNCVSTIDVPTSGLITVDGQDITGLRGKNLSRFRRERLGFIFQDCNLLDTLTAFENIALALTVVGTPVHEIDQRVTMTAALLGLEKVLPKYPYQLSGGEQQRVAAARAIITDPALVLADEPTGALDSKSARMLLTQLSGLNETKGSTILMVTHDAFTASWCRRILFLRDGRLFQELKREGQDRKQFFGRILAVVSELGGDVADVF
ncbi:MAG: ABC transporter ATP-binding protein [Clostridia bacterium]|nr:ABC transporter ATP-binding protein [Clostridia bacterium]